MITDDELAVDADRIGEKMRIIEKAIEESEILIEIDWLSQSGLSIEHLAMKSGDFQALLLSRWIRSFADSLKQLQHFEKFVINQLEERHSHHPDSG